MIEEGTAIGRAGLPFRLEASMESPHIKRCKRCGGPYDWRRSASRSLKMTYCGSLCERADLGFTIEALLTNPPHEPRGERLAA